MVTVRYDKDGVAIVQQMFLSPQNSYAETLSPNGVVSEAEPLGGD